jgi:hypothetical protein
LYYYRLRSLDSQGNASDLSEEVFASATGILEDPIAPDDFVLHPNEPNPFNASTVIRFSIAVGQKNKPAKTQLIILDVLGREVITLVNETLQAGEHRVLWSGTNARGQAVASGLYLIRLQVGEAWATRKGLLVK